MDLTGVLDVSAGLAFDDTGPYIEKTNHSCAVLSDSTVGCWGNNNWGQLGDGTKASSNVPVFVAAWR
jgi:alpha-tubulin suppressor-like RCC1 family protein